MPRHDGKGGAHKAPRNKVPINSRNSKGATSGGGCAPVVLVLMLALSAVPTWLILAAWHVA